MRVARSVAVDLELACRIEAAEAHNAVACAITRASLYPWLPTETREIAGGFAIYAGHPELSYGIGLGMDSAVEPCDLDMLEEFFRSHSLRPVLHLCPIADAGLFRELRRRRYEHVSDWSVMVRRVADLNGQDHRVRLAEAGDETRWCAIVAEGFLGHAPHSADDLNVGRLAWRMPGALRFIAAEAAAGALASFDGVAMLFSDATLPPSRGQGFHRALIATRLHSASQAGCDLATAVTTPGSTSFRNYLREGFTEVYRRAVMKSLQ